MTTSHPIVDAYVRAVNAADLGALLELFTGDATLVHPIGTFSGAEELRGFYRDVVLAGQAQLSVGDVLAEGKLAMAELVATSPLDPDAGAVHAVDVFRVDEQGLIERLEIYYR
jgi:ketosteroid isomerase-like protein